VNPKILRTVAAGALALALTTGPGAGLAPLFNAIPVEAAAAAAVDAATLAQLKAVVEEANAAQTQAFAGGDPAPMRATSTDDHYREMVQINRRMAQAGVTGVQLLKLDWGDASLEGASAKIETTETWRTAFADGSTEDSLDRNVYTLVHDGDAWKVQADDHPDADLEIGVPSSPNVPPGRPTQAKPGQSRNWSGYSAVGGSYTSVTGTWTIPQPDAAGSFGVDGTWVGIGGVDSRDLIQAGTDSTVAGNGRVRYSAWVEMLPAGPRQVPLAVKPGDSVTVTITEQAADQWLISMKDNTSGQTYSTTEQYHSSHSSAEWIEEAPAAGGRRILPLSNFGTIGFTGGSAVNDGQTVTIAGAHAEAVTMIDNSGTPIAVPSALGADGSSFVVNRVGPTAPPAVQPQQPRPQQPQAPQPGRRNRRPGGQPGFPPGLAPVPGFGF
jgi:hypothetical protein